MDTRIFSGCIPALMTPVGPDRRPNVDALVQKAEALIEAGMSAVVYCGSMGDWPLLRDEERMLGVEALVAAGVPVIVGTGAQSPKRAAALAAHARAVGAGGLMVIPRVLSRGTSPAAQQAHFAAVLEAADGLPAVIYNSPHYGFETRAELFFALRERYPNLVGFKEFGGARALSYAAEQITGHDPDLALLVGVDTQVFHGFVNCGAVGVITGIGNVLPREVLHLVALCERAAAGDVSARAQALELEQALAVLASFDEGPDLVLYYKYLMVLTGDLDYVHQIDPNDASSPSQRGYAEAQFHTFRRWYAGWSATASGASPSPVRP